MKHLVDRAFILSAETSAHDPGENHDRTIALRGDLASNGLAFKAVWGTYCGVAETGFLVVDRAMPVSDTVRETVASLARWYDQDSYLERHPDRTVTLHYLDGRSEHLGVFQRGLPRAEEDYTYDPRTGDFWVIR